jgi:cellobiose-specific phosphotransferase system component IIA
LAYQPTDWEHGDIITGGKLNKIEQELTHVADNATYGFGGAQLSSDGLTPFSYINAGDPMPANPQKGDTVFLKDGSDFLIYSYNGEDWVLKVDPDLSNRIEETIKTASDNTDKAIADNNTQINETINQVAKEQADLAIKDGDFNSKAQAMADKALSDAKANTATVAKSTLDTANQNIADAKKSVTDDIAQEASDRASAVSALDTKAQGYADTAKKNAIDVATSADGVINKKIDDTASSITSTVSQNKKDAEGKITTAQSTATQALNGLSSKVDTATYNAKTGQLSTDVTNVTQTANQAKTDIASIKQTDTTQDARMTTIEADASGTKTTVSNLQKAQNTQSGSISTLQQRADGFDATVTKVDNLSVGGRNYFLNSSGTSLDGWYQTSGWAVVSGTNRGTVFTIKPTATWGGGNYNAIYQNGINIPSGTQVTVSFWAKASVNGAKFHSEPNGSYSTYNPTLSTAWTRYSYTFTLTTTTIYFMGVDAGTIYYLDDVKIETGNVATDWTPAPEDVDSATAKAQLTADQATTALNNYKINADGRITKAQSDITQTAKDVTTKVSQTDYNAKTGDLDTRVTKAQLTADGAVTTVGAYKTSNDNRVKATETSIAQNTKDITLRATSTDLDSAKKDYNAQIAQVNVNADSITSQVSSVNSKIDNLSVGGRNYLISGTAALGWLGDNSIIGHNGAQGVIYDYISTTAKEVWSYSVWSDKQYTVTSEGKYLRYALYDSNKQQIMRKAIGLNMSTDTVKGQIVVNDNSAVAYIRISIDWVANGYGHAKFEKGNTPTDWSPAPEDVDNKISAQQVTIDGITDTVSKQGTNIDSVTKRVTTAEGTLSTATNNISGLQSSVTQTSNQIKTEITDRTKGDANTLQSSKDFTQSSITSYDKGVQTQLTQTANGILAQVEATNMVANSEFDPLNGTWYALSNGGSVGSTAGVAWSATQATGFADWPVVNGSRVISYASATWYTSALVSTSTGKVFSASIVAGRAPAPTVSTALDYRIGFWDSSRKLLTTSSEGNIIDGTAYKGVQKYVVENKTAPANTAFVSVIIAHSSANATDYITRPSLNTGAKASPYTPTYGTSSSATVLSLFKDNWSIGITDNISKITSGIVGNASQMSLISKNVTIDSPNTQIKGTAWIQSAMIANGAIGNAQIGDATITSAKIAQLDVAKLTGNVSTFIQSNWNGLYQSVKISPIGMTISTSQGSTAQFNQDGLVLDGALGTTNVLNGQIELISSSNEYLGTFQHETMPEHDNVDYLMIKLAGWHTSKPGDSDYDLNSDSSNTIRGGDGIGFGVTNSVGTYDMKMSWDSSLVAGYKGRKAGWHVEDIMTWHQPTYFEGGFDVAQQFSSTDRRALHIQGATLSNGHKWFGFFDTPSKAGFGTDDTNDVLFYMKGKSYSLYTMLSKLNML